jgi:radical SAM superfamily enzyme YgiQ (UPF0313 family)
MANRDLIYLVNPPNDEGMASISNYHCFPALSCLALGTWLNKSIPDLEVIARDGGVHTQERILDDINRLRPGIIGTSVLCTTYKNSLEIACAGKDVGSIIIFGNDQASHLGHSILKKRKEVDFVIGAEYGELDLELLIRNLRGENIKLSDIPTLVYRDGNNEVQGFDINNPIHRKRISIVNDGSLYPKLWDLTQIGFGNIDRKKALDIFPLTNRNLYPQDHWNSYLKNYLEKYSNLHYEPIQGVTTMNRARGCDRQAENICQVCDMALDISMSPLLFWEEVKSANEQVGSTLFYEVCDSFTSFPQFIKLVANSKPSNIGFTPKFFVYGQARNLADNPERVEMLKEIGVLRVNIGLEAMSDTTLKRLKGDRDSVEKNFSALRLLKQNGIFAYASFVLGTEYETKETLDETVEGVKNIVDDGLVIDLEAQPILPLPRNYQGGQLIKKGYISNEELDSDLPWHSENSDRLSEIYIDNFSGVSFEETIDACKEIRDYSEKNKVRWGSGVLKESKYQ